MMRSMLGIVLAGGLGLSVLAGSVTAQTTQVQQNNPMYRPAVSPYLNMARPGNSAVNYFGLVKPQFDVNKQLQTLQMQQAANMQQMGTLQEHEDGLMAGYVLTGHPVTFFNYSHYYFQGGTGAGARPGQTQIPIMGKKY